MSSLISTDQLASAQQYLNALDVRSLLRGEKYWRQNRVLKLSRGEDENHIYATVRGTEPYQVSLYFSDGAWAGTCSCMIGADCKHCCAAMLEVADRAKKFPQQKTVKPAKPVSKTEAQPAYESSKFAALIRSRLGRPLTVEDQRAASAVDDIYTKYRGAKLVSENVFDRIRGTQALWSWNSVEVWPKSPRTPWDTWLYVAALIRRKGWNCPPAFLAVTGQAEVEAFLGSWERKMQIEKWEDWLRDTAERSTAAVSMPKDSVSLRVMVNQKGVQLEWRKAPGAEFAELKPSRFKQFAQDAQSGRLPFDAESLSLWRIFYLFGCSAFFAHDLGHTHPILNQVLRLPGCDDRTVNADGAPFKRAPEPLVWSAQAPPPEELGDYRLQLVTATGTPLEPPMVVVDGDPSIYITADTIFQGPPLGGLDIAHGPQTIPAEALETHHGLKLLDRIALPHPERIAAKVRSIRLRAVFRCSLESSASSSERFEVTVSAETADGIVYSRYTDAGWTMDRGYKEPKEPGCLLVRYDHSALQLVPELIEDLRVSWHSYGYNSWSKQAGRSFPEQFAQWLATIPDESGIILEIDPVLATLRDKPVAAQVSLDVRESGIDWFDLQVALSVSDATLSQEEIRMLMDAKGGFVRLGAKGWRRLQFELSEEDERELADLGLSARDFSSETQRLHALQLAGKKAAVRMLPEEQCRAIERRSEEIRTRVTPDLPAGLQATLRPYQVEGFHFLAYLAENHFGGILADDMGLGKTIQTLAWVLWLRSLPDFTGLPTLVVCPKSVTDNWLSEAALFTPKLPVMVMPRGTCDAKALATARKKAGIIVINYSQLRSNEAFSKVAWQAAILDEAQYIKNPQSQTAQSASLLNAAHRLALTGTPIENRLLDLWSIMQFTMPGVLGNRAAFSRDFDQRSDPLARRRLAARVRPFVIRRTKREVAKDLPERTEEDLLCELEGEQAKLYKAELKRARAALLKIKTSSDLDKARFNILTSMLRLRQICCHPVLVNATATNAESAKLTALLDLLEPLMEEGQKVLVFSQFVEMLSLIQNEVVAREWKHFLLTGNTEDRGALVREFQQSEGSAVFLISLRAGGFGLNLTAASYVVLYDPWWNPAVENQAIDRTHRIGQKNQVIAYRLIVKESIEEKIRRLQKQKSGLADDILGEENFTRALTLDDFRFLLEG